MCVAGHAAITGTYAAKSTTMQTYEKLYKLIIEYICVQSGLERAIADEAAAEEVRGANGPCLNALLIIMGRA